MKRKLFISLIISFITVLAYNVQVQADTTITRVTSNDYEDSFPCINDDYLVWQAYVDGDWEIKLYDMVGTGGTLTITDNDYNDVSPQTDGNYVVWFGSTNQGGEIFLYKISDGSSTQITSNTDSNVYSPPQIADGRVVWTSHEVGDSIEPGEIILYDIGPPASSTPLTNNILNDSPPRINSEYVVWLQIDEDDNSTLFRYLLPAGPAEPAPEGFIWKDSPQTDGDLTVSMRNDGSDWDIIVRKDGENGFEQVTDNSMNDRYPRISGNNIAWMGGEGTASEIYVALYDAGTVCSLADFAAEFGRTDCSGTCNCDNGDNDVDGSDLAMLSQN